MDTTFTIIGLDRVGISLGLALKKADDGFVCTGFDFEAFRRDEAARLKAVDKTEADLHPSVRNADIVLLNVPAGDVIAWLDELMPELKDDAVLVNLSAAHNAVCEWAAAHLPAHRNVVNATPSIQGSCLSNDEPTADLFKEGLVLVSTPRGTGEQAIQQVEMLSEILGSTVMFSDPLEADGLLSQIDLFPRLAMLLYLRSITGQPGWKDARKITGPVFWQAAQILGMFPVGKLASQEITYQRENTLRMLEMLREQIDRLQEEIQSDEAAVLEQSLQKTLEDHDAWVKQRIEGSWDGKGKGDDEVKSAGIWKKLLGISLPQKKK